MAAAIDASHEVVSTGGSTSITSTNWTIAGSNRVLYSMVETGAGTPEDPTGVKWEGSGGTSLTKQGSTLDLGSFWKTSLYRLIAPNAAAGTSYASFANSQDEILMVMISVKDADQTTPNRTVATATGTNTTPSAAATSVSGDLVIDFACFGDSGGSSRTLAVGASQTSLEEIEGADAVYEGMGCSHETATGVSTTMSWTISGANDEWGIFALAIIEAAAPGGSSIVPIIMAQFRQRK